MIQFYFWAFKEQIFQQLPSISEEKKDQIEQFIILSIILPILDNVTF